MAPSDVERLYIISRHSFAFHIPSGIPMPARRLAQRAEWTGGLHTLCHGEMRPITSGAEIFPLRVVSWYLELHNVRYLYDQNEPSPMFQDVASRRLGFCGHALLCWTASSGSLSKLEGREEVQDGSFSHSQSRENPNSLHSQNAIYQELS